MQNNPNIPAWIESSPDGQKDFRRAIHVLLTAISRSPQLKKSVVLKGGILLALGYGSHRFTKDIDLSFRDSEKDIQSTIEAELNRQLTTVSAELNLGISCRVQSCRRNPRNPQASFPSLKLTVGFAKNGSSQHRRLLRGQATSVIEIDLSFNETIISIDSMQLGPDHSYINCYAYSDLVAEKFRALLQQTDRNRYRRQDIYDLHLLVELAQFSDSKDTVLQTFLKKCRARGIEPTIHSMDNPEIRRRSAKDWKTLADEIPLPLPDFDELYDAVKDRYQQLPWIE